LQLTAEERVLLAERLIASVDLDPEVEKAWADGVERRDAKIRSGAVTLLDGAAVIADLRREFA
jgi:hypothetical protein